MRARRQLVLMEVAAVIQMIRARRFLGSNRGNQVRRMVAGSRIGGGTLGYGRNIAGCCTVIKFTGSGGDGSSTFAGSPDCAGIADWEAVPGVQHEGAESCAWDAQQEWSVG